MVGGQRGLWDEPFGELQARDATAALACCSLRDVGPDDDDRLISLGDTGRPTGAG